MLTVITGPPCSGKSTYMRQHALPGDITIDFDDLAQAFGSPVRHDHAHPIWKVTIEARDTAIKTAVAQHHAGAKVWIVDSSPVHSRRQWYHQQGARMVELTAERAELHRRADADGRPPRWHARIDQFLDGKDPQPAGRTRW